MWAAKAMGPNLYLADEGLERSFHFIHIKVWKGDNAPDINVG